MAYSARLASQGQPAFQPKRRGRRRGKAEKIYKKMWKEKSAAEESYRTRMMDFFSFRVGVQLVGSEWKSSRWWTIHMTDSTPIVHEMYNGRATVSPRRRKTPVLSCRSYITRNKLKGTCTYRGRRELCYSLFLSFIPLHFLAHFAREWDLKK